MLTYALENRETNSLYEYLYKCIRRDILNGTIAAGEKLPSKRSFAKNLGVSVITVENAYAQLVAEGYLYSVPKSGYYAAEIRKNLLTPARETEMGNTGETKVNSGRNDFLADFVNGRMDSDQFPFTIWARLLRGVLSTRKEELMEKAPGMGVPELRQAIAHYLLQFQGMQVRKEQIIIGAGTEYLYSLLIQLLGRDKIYALEDPGYRKIAQVYRSYGVKTVYIPMDSNGVQPSRLTQSNADIMHISPSHHYPTGITTPIGRRYELLSWANEGEERYVIEDDYDCEFRLAGKSIPSLQSIDEAGRVIYMNTFTKSLTPTIRISYMVLPETLLSRFQERLGFYSCTVSNFEQYTLAEFIRRGYFEKHINRMRNYYRNKRDEFLAVIAGSRLGDRVHIKEADAGLHFLMKADTKLSDAQLVERAEQAGIRISCLSQYCHLSGETKTATVVVNYSGLETGQMKQAADCLYEAWFETTDHA